MKPFAFRTPVAIPELGAEAGDRIDYDPAVATAVYVIREVPLHHALETFRRVRDLADALPADPDAQSLPRFGPLTLVGAVSRQHAIEQAGEAHQPEHVRRKGTEP